MENTKGIKLVQIGQERIVRLKEFAKLTSKVKERRISANDIIIDAIDEYLEKYK
jgi:hypothetical protein